MSLVIRKMKITVRYHFIATRMARTKKSDNKYGKGGGEAEHSYATGGNGK